MNQVFNLTGGGNIGLVKDNKMDAYLYLLIFFIIKVFLVQYTYNVIAPRLIMNYLDRPVRDFKPLSFMEAAMLQILANNLFT